MYKILRITIFLFSWLIIPFLIAKPVNLVNLLSSNNVATLGNIAGAYLTLQSQSIYLIEQSKDNATEIAKYTIMNETLTYQANFQSENIFNGNYEMEILQSSIVIFPIQQNSQSEVFNLNSPFSYPFQVPSNNTYIQIIPAPISQLIFISTASGDIGFTSVDQFKLGQLRILQGSQHIGNTFISISPNEIYLCSTDYITGLATIWSVLEQTIFASVILNETGIRSHVWSDDSIFLYIIGYSQGIIYTLDSRNNFQVDAIIQTNTPMLSNVFFYEQNGLIGVSYNNSSLVLIDLDSSKHTYYSLNVSNPTKLKVDISNKYFLVMNNQEISLFKIDSHCNDKQFFNRRTNSCNACPQGCHACNIFQCFACTVSYSMNQKNVCIIQTIPDNSTKTVLQNITQSLSQFTFNIVNSTFKLPGQRQFLNVFFELFNNFDHLVLYIYHNRTYGPNMQQLLQTIHDSIDYRFQIINQNICKNDFGIDLHQMKNSIDFKLQYSNLKFANLESIGQGFFANNLQYFLLNIPLITLILIIYRTIFRWLFNYRISILLRKFSFWSVIILLLLQGNVQLFSFTFAADFEHLFSSRFHETLFNSATILMAFIWLIISSLGLFSYFIVHKNLSRYFYENSKGSLNSALFFVFSNGVMNVTRGFIHRFAITSPHAQVLSLMLIELFEAVLIVYCLKYLKLFKSKFMAILGLLGNIFRIILNMTLIFSNRISLDMIDKIHVVICMVTFTIFFIGIFHSFYESYNILKKVYLACNVKPKLTFTSSKQYSFRKYIFKLKNPNKNGKQKQIQKDDLNGRRQCIKVQYIGKRVIKANKTGLHF